MKYSSISFKTLYNFALLCLFLFWTAFFAGIVEAQEITPSQTERIETDHDHFIGTGAATAAVSVKNARQMPPGELQGCYPQFEQQIQMGAFEQIGDTRVRFVRPEPSYAQNLSGKSPELNIPLKGSFELPDPLGPKEVPVLNDEFERPFERFLYGTGLPGEKAAAKTDDDPPAKLPPGDRFHWRPAINQSLMLLGVQHGYALAVQEKTRRALANGNFFTDYWRSVKGLHGWDDGNRFFTNYVAHPMQGALTGFIFIQNHDGAKKQKFGDSKQYWKDRFKAFVWSTAWSTQWELGPVGQAAIGNLGLYKGMGYVDLVITPTVGTGWLMTEEAIDRYIIRHIEKQSFVVKMFARVLMNPMRAVANVLRFREPWYRDRPFGQ